jgi:hypothetical protein
MKTLRTEKYDRFKIQISEYYQHAYSPPGLQCLERLRLEMHTEELIQDPAQTGFGIGLIRVSS